MPQPESCTQRFANLSAPLAIATLLAALCWFRGGVDPAVSAAVFGVVLTACAALFLWGASLGIELRLPWPIVVVTLLPVAQLVPFGAARNLLWPSWREDLTHRFAEFGVESASSISIYPYATLRSAAVVAGCCGLFVLARAVAENYRGGAAILAAMVLTVATAEAILGLWQVFGEGAVPGHATASAVAQAQGTFGNRNHFAVLLETGFCLALGFIARSERTDHASTAASHWFQLATYATAAALCLTGIVASGSRMGIIVACATAVTGARILVRGKRHSSLPIALAALLFVAVLSFPQMTGGFEKLVNDKGDPGRIAIWSDALATAARHLPTGSGLGTFAFAFRRSEPYFPRNTVDHAHSDALEFLVELGLAGLLFAAAIAFAFRHALRRPNRTTPAGTRELKTACLLGAAAILLHSTVDFPLQIPALAAMFCVLLGSAVGLASDSAPARRTRLSYRLSGALACGLLTVISAAVALGHPRSWDAESLHQNAMRRLLAGEPIEADRLFQRSLAANPYAAHVWQKRAEAAQLTGRRDEATKLLTLAAQLEPFTFRTEWPLAQAALREKRWEDAARRLGNLARTVPDLQPVIFRAALDAQMPLRQIVQEIVPPEAAGVWLRLLANREAWRELDQTLSHWDSQSIAVSSVELRHVFDRLFQLRQASLMKRLWQSVGGENSPGPAALPSLAMNPKPASSYDRFSQWENDPFALGFGFQWVSHPLSGVRISLHQPAQATPYVKLDVHLPAAYETVHLSRYFAVTPATSYVLAARTWAEGPSDGEIRLEAWSASRLAGTSPPARGSSPQQMEVRFRAGPNDEVLQLQVVSKSAALKELRGTFYVGDLELRRDRANTAIAKSGKKASAGG